MSRGKPSRRESFSVAKAIVVLQLSNWKDNHHASSQTGQRRICESDGGEGLVG